MSSSIPASGLAAASNPFEGFILSPDQHERLGKLASLRECYVGYPIVMQAWSGLNKMKLMASYPESYGTSARAMLLTGPSGSGKSRLLQKFAAQHPRDTSAAEGDICPVVYVQLFGVCTRLTLVRLCLEALNVPFSPRATTGMLTTLLMHHLREQKVEMLILDEANHLINMHDQRLDYEAADFIKTILNAIACSVVVAGLPAARTIFTANSQLRRRMHGAIHFAPFSKTDDNIKLFHLAVWRYGQHVEEKTGLDVSVLKDPLTGLRLQHHCDGLPPRAFDCIYSSVEEAILRQATKLSIDVFHEVANQKRDLEDEDWTNPFEMHRDELLGRAYSSNLLDTGSAVRLSARKRTAKMKDLHL